MSKILITGGTGFIGSHIVDEICKDEFNTAIVADINLKSNLKAKGKRLNNLWISPTGYISESKSARYYCCDIRDYASVFNLFELIKPQYVIHCAALARIQPSLAKTIETYATNVTGTINLLEASRKFGVKKFIYSGSSSVYGDQIKMPLKETMKPEPLNPYAYSKLMAEMLIEQYVKNFGLKAVVLRYFNVYGPRQPSDGQYATIIGIFLRQWRNQEPFSVVTNEYGGHQRRDYTYVSDVVSANILAMESDKVGDGTLASIGPFNIGAGKNYSIWEAAERIAGGPDYKWVKAPDRFGEAKETLADISKAKKLLGWKPQISFEKGIEILKREM
jgi:UDP-glucose 4-epimerase